jgi:putative transposase
MQYRRSQARGVTFFFTVKSILCHNANVAIIKEAFQYVIKQHPFRIWAFVLLSDHIPSYLDITRKRQCFLNVMAIDQELFQQTMQG